MADTEEPHFNSLAERIAALNKQKNFQGPEPPRKRPPPPAPPGRPVNNKNINTSESSTASVSTSSNDGSRPTVPSRPARPNVPPPLPRRETQSSIASQETACINRTAVSPPLPPRTTSSHATPTVPRQTSSQPNTYLSARRNSGSSEVSQHSTVSTTSMTRTTSSNTSYTTNGSVPRKMAPATCDPASLPPLPPSRRESEARTSDTAVPGAVTTKEAMHEIRTTQATKKQGCPTDTRDPSSTPAAVPKLPPRLPARPAKPPIAPSVAAETDETKAAGRKLPFGTIRGFSSGQTAKPPSVPTQRPKLPSRPSNTDTTNDITRDDAAPPPVPVASRPSIAQIEAISAGPTAKVPGANGGLRSCWVCRDWSGPDTVAAQFPRQSLPRNDTVGHLARGLCDPFPSYDDKARAIFTWFHHNIAYDTVSFFGNNVRHMSVEDTIFSGQAVCQGYAETYKAIANRAGLECIVVGGHGKGFGYAPLKKGERVPPAKPDGHAWNAVRVDGGAWKLVDACWGAGHICSAANLFKQEFSPRQFTATNEKFGLRHFPQDSGHQFRSDGRTVTWEEYYRGGVDGEPHQWYGTGESEGIAEDSVEPKARDISVYSEQVVRFQFSKICEHWTSEKAGVGKPALFLFSIHGVDGRKDEIIPTETNGYWNWVDVNARDLGAPGQTVEILKLETMDNADARGITAQEFLAKRGRVGMSWSYIAKWNLV